MKLPPSMMSLKTTALVLTIASIPCFSQGDGYSVSRKGSLSIMPLYQRWSLRNDKSFSEFSSVLSLYLPAGREWSFALRGAPASASGDVKSLSGLSDIQLSIAYKMDRPSLAFTLGVNFPTGRKELTQEEFETSILLANSVFNMQAPSFGLGFDVNPGIVWAVPFSDNVVAGLGVAYHYHGKYRPLKNFNEYDPGDEFLVTGGIDYRLDEASSVAADVIFWTYGKDKLDAAEVFAAGNKVVAKIQVRRSFNLNELWTLVRYRSRAKSDVAIGGALVPEPQAVDPDQFEAIIHYNIAVNNRLSLKLIGEGRFYQKTPSEFSGVRLLGVGVIPSISVSQDVSIPLRVKYQSGKTRDGTKISGVEAGVVMVLTY